MLNEGSGIFFDRYPGMYNDVRGTTALRNLPSALSRLATSFELSADTALAYRHEKGQALPPDSQPPPPLRARLLTDRSWAKND